MAATTTCPFECGWDSGEATTEEEGRAVLRAHLTVEHEARPERNEQAWADEMADMQADLELTAEERERWRSVERQAEENRRAFLKDFTRPEGGG